MTWQEWQAYVAAMRAEALKAHEAWEKAKQRTASTPLVYPFEKLIRESEAQDAVRVLSPEEVLSSPPVLTVHLHRGGRSEWRALCGYDKAGCYVERVADAKGAYVCRECLKIAREGRNA